VPSGITGGDTFHLISKVLDLRQASHAQTAENLAHQDTPGYEAKHLSFDGALRDALGHGGVKMSATSAGHLSGGSAGPAINRVTGTETVVRDGAGADGNTVNPEDEMATLAENNLMYNAATQIMGAKYRAMRNIINEGR